MHLKLQIKENTMIVNSSLKIKAIYIIKI